MGNINFQLTEDEHKQLKDRCVEEDVKIKDVIPALVRYYLGNGIKVKSTIEIVSPRAKRRR